jgi:hypothetical protein
MDTMTVKPVPGMTVRDPETRAELPAGGASVPRTSFWLRRLVAGDVAPCDAPQPAPVSDLAKSDAPPLATKSSKGK